MEHLEKSIRILHVDDEPEFAELVEEMLGREDPAFEMEIVTNADEGHDRLSEDDFDCVVSDYEMPGKTGLEFLREVRMEHPDLPFILFTGKGSEEVASEAVSAGVTDYLQKQPGNQLFELLANRIRNAVSQFRAERTVERNQLRFQTLVEEATDVILIVSPDGTISYATPSAESVLGRTPDDLEGSDGFEPVHQADREQVMEDFAELVEQPGGRKTTEFRYEKPDGSAIWAEARGRNLLDDPIINGIVVYVRDTTERKERELELQRTERRYQAIFNDPNILVGLIDTHGTVLEINDTAMEYVASTHEGVTGTKFWETPWFKHSESLQEDVKNWIDRASNGEYVEFEAKLAHSNGDPYIVEGVFRPVTNDDGEVVSLIISDRDVTERKQHERELERYKAYLEESTDIITVFDESGRVKYESPAVSRILGYEQGELVGQNGFDFIHPEDVDEVIEAFSQGLSEPGATATAEYRFQTANDEWCWLEARGTNQLDHEAINGIVTSNRDITERKLHEERLERINQRTQELMHTQTVEETAEIGVTTATEDLDFDVAGFHLQHDADSLVPIAFSDKEDLFESPPKFARSGERKSVAEFVWNVFESEEPTYIEDTTTSDRLAGQTPIRSAILYPLSDHGMFIVSATEPSAFDQTDRASLNILVNSLIAALERTDREQALRDRSEKLERQNERLEEFTSVVSHDLRNPLNVASARIELAEGECDSEHLDHVGNALDRMELLIEDLLTLAREGDEIGELERIDLASTLKACWQNIATGDAELTADVDISIPADSSRVGQLLENLIGNAIEHGGKDVTVSVGEMDGGFYIEDDGPGIPEDDRETVFDAGYTTSQEGTGFGLSIVKRVAEAHGWNIRVINGSEGGARFEITGVEKLQ